MKQSSRQTIAKTFKVIYLVTVISTFLPIMTGSNAYADPPPWAPAHGYREKHNHDRNHQREEDDDDDEDKGKRVRVVPAQPVYVAPYGISQGTCNRQLLGKVLGGAAGAAIGSQIGRGNGNTAAIIAGTVLGVIVGGNVGQSMDRVDQGCVGQILEHAPDGRPITWTDTSNGGRYRVTPDKPYQTSQGQYCRKYLTNALIDGNDRQIYSTACRQPDGTWQMVN